MEKDRYTIDIAKKILEKAMVNELYKNGVIEFAVCSSVVKKIDNEIEKIKCKNENNDERKQVVIKISI